MDHGWPVTAALSTPTSAPSCLGIFWVDILVSIWSGYSEFSHRNVVLNCVLLSFSPLADDRWRVCFSVSKTYWIKVLFQQQLCCLHLQSNRHLPVRCCHEPVPHRHRQVLDRPAATSLPACVSAWLEVHQLLKWSLHRELHLQRECEDGKRRQVGDPRAHH